ncbi:MAG: hypothetical protein ACSHXY_01985 [Alphaproteobacteria bacterium]
MPKIALIAVTLSALVFAMLIPVLEINATHLTNSEWPAHARLHEAWQLFTNAALSILALALVWTRRSPRIGLCIALIICISFLLSWVLGNLYGGSMLHDDGTQMAIGGFNVAVLIVLVLTMLLGLGYRAASSASENI